MIINEQPNDYRDVDLEFSGVTDLIAHEFRMLGCQVQEIGRLVSICLEDKEVFTFDSETSYTSRVSTRVLKNKAVARQLIKEAGLRVANGRLFSKSEKAKAFSYIEQIGSGVIKPVDGSHGRGVSVGVSVGEFDLAWGLAANLTRNEILIEEYFSEGTEARYLIVDGQ
ncbi:hypothetical protein GV827_18055 [Sulfitobacter sp. JBTF-M27]|uniref:ATP-grasp domain-containing protein n=1 Tax=Sulfitobacter sediminilitoris TaxID=2698830 RepID=A0A6P0CDP2_9RHOB|nr:hypothetical protein [Sulfitobacter sediminilitoris]NEK24292.1 hypothetical protein [Sulfitobacter sediminilitoris]